MSLIRNSNQVKQSIDFSGFQNGKIHPSDIDAVLEFDNEALILIEVKRKHNEIPTGQRLLLERICDSWHTQKSTVLFVIHEFKDETKDIPLSECFLKSYYFNGVWSEAKSETNLKSALNKLGEVWSIDKLTFK